MWFINFQITRNALFGCWKGLESNKKMIAYFHNLTMPENKDYYYFQNKINFNSRMLFSDNGTNKIDNNSSSVASVLAEAKTNKKIPNLSVIFELNNGQQLIGKACHGDTLLDVVLNNQLEIDGFGACEGTLACSTCHLILDQEDFQRMQDKITDEEMDMLDLAHGLTETSRLGCQIYMTKELDKLKVKIPPGVNDVRLN